MKYRFKNLYMAHRPMRIATYVFLTGLCVLLVWAAGGIPPVSWRILFQALPALPHLWLVQRTALLLPFSLLVMQAFTWLILACLLLRAWATVLYYSWSAKQQSPAVVSTSLYTDMDMYNATTDAFLLSDLSPSVTTSGRHPAIHIPTQPDNGGTHVAAPPFSPMPVPVPPPSTPAQRTSPSPYWTFDSSSYP
jgi:hypothetical protein